jgi:GT2 family glycosyltransferase
MDVAPMSMAVVVIGRNEGKRLGEGLRSAQATGLPVVYVDSGSSDGSPAIARELGVMVLELDPSRPFSAARARNEGLNVLLKQDPDLQYVVFLDGDCVLDLGFPGAASSLLDEQGDVAIVTGHLSERSPDASIYNRLCSIEWRSPAGRIENFAALGGIMAARVSAFRQVGGFNEQVIAGEDSELGVRLKLAGHSIVKIDRPMATHDAELLRFSQWWKRAVRGGHALAQRYELNGGSKLQDCRREFYSTLLWGLAVPLLVILFLWPTRGLSLLLLGGYLLLGWRIFRYYSRSGLPRDDAMLAARFTICAKFANLLGVIRYFLNRMRGSFRIIEYKTGQ